MELGASVLPPLPMHGGDRNRTSPFAFTGNKFEFRAVGSSDSLAFPNTVLNTIVAESIDDLADGLEKKIEAGTDLARRSRRSSPRPTTPTSRSASWATTTTRPGTTEAEKRGLKNLRTTPDALPEVLADSTVTAFEKYSVLSKRELESRYEVWIEQYTINANIEAETADSIARTMLLPAALRYLELINEAEISELGSQTRELIDGAGQRPSTTSSRPTPTRTASRAWTSRSTPATTRSPRWPMSARSPTSSRRSSPTTSGRCRSTRRCSSSDSCGATGRGLDSGAWTGSRP